MVLLKTAEARIKQRRTTAFLAKRMLSYPGMESHGHRGFLPISETTENGPFLPKNRLFFGSLSPPDIGNFLRNHAKEFWRFADRRGG